MVHVHQKIMDFITTQKDRRHKNDERNEQSGSLCSPISLLQTVEQAVQEASRNSTAQVHVCLFLFSSSA